MSLGIFHSVNAGLYLWDGESGLLIDGIHDGREDGFSPMPAALAEQLRTRTGLFAHLNGVIFTHWHLDHFHPQGLVALQRFPQPPVIYGPGRCGPSVPVRANRRGQYRLRIGEIDIMAQDVLHDGKPFYNHPHQSLLIRMGGENIFVAGDALLKGVSADDFRPDGDGRISAGFFNLYQIASLEGQAFIRALKPERVFLYHLPFTEDDRYHYCDMARQVIKRIAADMPPTELLSHMAWVDGRAPDWYREA